MKIRNILAISTVAILSAGCGGGGGTDIATQASTATTTAIADAVSTIVNSAPAAVYSASSEELSAFNLLNAERARCGFGVLAQSTKLDAAAKAHADYQIINSLNSHFEDKTAYPNGFTGVYDTDRVAFQGYTDAGFVVDLFSVFNTSDPTQVKTGYGAMGIRSLLNAPYHMGGLVSGMRDVGIAVRTKADTGAGAQGIFVQVNTAYKSVAGRQLLGPTDVGTYPCDGSAGINWKMAGENPNPVPGRDLAVNPLGSSVYIALREGNTLGITSSTMTNVATGAAVTLRAPVTTANDPYAPCISGCYKSHEGYIAADAPLTANTQYQVNVTGNNNGITFSRSFTFTTGS